MFEVEMKKTCVKCNKEIGFFGGIECSEGECNRKICKKCAEKDESMACNECRYFYCDVHIKNHKCEPEEDNTEEQDSELVITESKNEMLISIFYGNYAWNESVQDEKQDMMDSLSEQLKKYFDNGYKIMKWNDAENIIYLVKHPRQVF